MNDSGLGRLFGVLFSPVKTFRAIAERPTWVWPLLVISLLTAGMAYVMYQRVDMATYIQQQQQKSGQAQQSVPAEQMEAQEKFFQAMNRYMPAVMGGFFLLFMPFILLFVTLLYWGGFRLIGSEITYRQSFATVVHGSMPMAMSALLAVPVILSRQEISMEETQRGGVLASNLAALAPEGTGPVLLAFLSGIDFFLLWNAVLLILGFEIVARVKRSTATWVVLVVFLITIGFRVGSVALGAAMGR